MTRRTAAGGLGLASVALLLWCGAVRAEPPERFAELVHADLPIFGYKTERMWPQGFADADGWGCTSRVAFGDWKFVPLDEGGPEPEGWHRFANYGVFHCFALVSEAEERDALSSAAPRHSFFVHLGDTGSGTDRRELWAIQIGGRPGSDYVLLARKPGGGIIESFELLQRTCPTANIRDKGAIDILPTRYCAINSRADLVRMAKRMANVPPLGTLSRVADAGARQGADE